MFHHPTKFTRGFSLIEVIVAMGIVATVMVGLIGIMPAGVESLHEAATTAIESRIVQEMISDAQQSDWDNRAAPAGVAAQPKLDDLMGPKGLRRYDSEGSLLVKASTVGKTPVYAAKMEYADSDAGHKAKVLNYTKGYTHLRRVKISVAFTPGGKEPNWNSAKYAHTYSVMIANMGTSEFLTQ